MSVPLADAGSPSSCRWGTRGTPSGTRSPGTCWSGGVRMTSCHGGAPRALGPCDAPVALAGDPNGVDAVVLVVDAGNLARNLFLALQVIARGTPAVVALNLVDQAEAAGKVVDPEALSRELGVPVVRTVASRGEGAGQVLTAAVAALG